MNGAIISDVQYSDNHSSGSIVDKGHRGVIGASGEFSLLMGVVLVVEVSVMILVLAKTMNRRFV